ncbi:hypothetical protein B0A78_09105 [Flavobacterium columnare NBRC 100251 = ATCC 23463]|uniref:YhhN-like protein n=1 Tax=Flavobacterium columnare (strain ATCC 49512 / CIP 103533 / TG 44/87) TaxID=1041826 RepID=G8X647_FLACA|nr:hypothetical protein [Flavobacterium columnare]AEW86277.1 hypothetical protein FCOL_07290 [Flavobacterium columnare ATCC 49512]MBF6652789.1 hypothetical protein [Flavobacterium columnare]PDS23512.1 hypothetical protein B0A78_09105 [Flavobacterium columnare NBRC 100251 = ATCC 23463]PTD14989.1 hypothetical protein C6N29_11445 [Flavobacterium columnare]QOG90379.1 hypothetical protein HUE41_10445 [Flavobacterium columnare]
MKIQKIAQLFEFLFVFDLILYGVMAFLQVDILEEYLRCMSIPLLFILYIISSLRINMKFLVCLIIYQVTSSLFAIEGDAVFKMATLFSLVSKMGLIYLILEFIEKKDRTAIGVALVPLFVLYLYMINFVFEQVEEHYIYWVFNSLLTAFLGAVGVITYVNQMKKENLFFLIATVFLVIQMSLFFFNMFYYESIFLHKWIVVFSALAYYMIYKFLILKENAQNMTIS